MQKDNRKKKSSGKRTKDNEKLIQEILNNNDISVYDLKTSKAKKVIEAKRRIAYILKVLSHKDSSEIKNYLNISQTTLIRYVSSIKKRINSKKLTIITLPFSK